MLLQKNSYRTDCGKRIVYGNLFRRLWEQHVMWTRSFIISTAAELGDLQYVTQRLLRNPEDFAKALTPFYGAEKAKKFGKLLTEHLTIAAQLVNAAKAGKKEEADTYRKNWYKNADEIAAFLAEINPNWSAKAWTTMLYNHLKITEEEATLRLSGMYEKDIALYDDIEAQALGMADYMTDGIIKQFRL